MNIGNENCVPCMRPSFDGKQVALQQSLTTRTALIPESGELGAHLNVPPVLELRVDMRRLHRLQLFFLVLPRFDFG